MKDETITMYDKFSWWISKSQLRAYNLNLLIPRIHLTAVRVLVRTSGAFSRCWRRRAQRANKHTSIFTERESKKQSWKVTILIIECAAKGGAFALVRLRIAPSFPLGGISLNPLTFFARTTFPRCAFLLSFSFAPSCERWSYITIEW